MARLKKTLNPREHTYSPDGLVTREMVEAIEGMLSIAVKKRRPNDALASDVDDMLVRIFEDACPVGCRTGSTHLHGDEARLFQEALRLAVEDCDLGVAAGTMEPRTARARTSVLYSICGRVFRGLKLHKVDISRWSPRPAMSSYRAQGVSQ